MREVGVEEGGEGEMEVVVCTGERRGGTGMEQWVRGSGGFSLGGRKREVFGQLGEGRRLLVKVVREARYLGGVGEGRW